MRHWLRHLLGTEGLIFLLHRVLHRIDHLEELVATATEQLNALNTQFDDFASDVRAALAVINDDQLSPQAQEALDGLSAKLSALDTEVGDADGSDTPVVDEPADPVDEDTTRL
jgi:hypothetical protein